MTLAYAGAGLIALAIVVAVGVFTRPSSESPVTKSLALIGVSDPRAAQPTEVTSESLTERALELAALGARRLSPVSAISKLERGLDRAGRPVPWTVERILGAKGLSALTGLLLGFSFGGITIGGIGLALMAGIVLFYLPDLLIYNTALRRQDQIMRGFAEVLDMLTICVEAGQGFDAALLEVARNVRGPVSGELARMTAEMQIGTSRSDAFRALGDRVGQSDVKNFVTAISQADKLGIPIASVLREQTTAMRMARKQKAEAQAQKITVKILFPLMLCIFPALLAVILGPGVIRIIQTFSQGT